MSAKKSTAMTNLQARADAVQAAAAADGQTNLFDNVQASQLSPSSRRTAELATVRQSKPANAKNFYQSDTLNVISSSAICSIRHER
jgi:hypothetical protein